LENFSLKEKTGYYTVYLTTNSYLFVCVQKEKL
jgi:hypothetical protein